VHRFRCVNAVCRRSTFAAPLDELAVRSAQRTRGQELAVQNVGLALGGNTVQISTDGLPPLRYTEQRGSEYRRGEGCGDAGGWALVVARPVPSSIHLALYLNGIDPCGCPGWGALSPLLTHFITKFTRYAKVFSAPSAICSTILPRP